MVGELVRTINVAGFCANPRDLTTDGKYIWLIDSSQTRYIHMIDKLGNLIKSIDVTAIDNPRGLTTDGKYLWWSGTSNNIIVKMDKDGNVINTFASPLNLDVLSITTDRKNLLLITFDVPGGTLYQIDKIGNIIRGLNVTAITGNNPGGLTTDGKLIWFGSATNDLIYQFDKTGNVIRTINIAAIDGSIVGLTTDRKYLYWSGTVNRSIYQMNK